MGGIMSGPSVESSLATIAQQLKLIVELLERMAGPAPRPRREVTSEQRGEIIPAGERQRKRAAGYARPRAKP